MKLKNHEWTVTGGLQPVRLNADKSNRTEAQESLNRIAAAKFLSDRPYNEANLQKAAGRFGGARPTEKDVAHELFAGMIARGPHESEEAALKHANSFAEEAGLKHRAIGVNLDKNKWVMGWTLHDPTEVSL
jgi:hypothetical protein